MSGGRGEDTAEVCGPDPHSKLHGKIGDQMQSLVVMVMAQQAQSRSLRWAGPLQSGGSAQPIWGNFRVVTWPPRGCGRQGVGEAEGEECKGMREWTKVCFLRSRHEGEEPLLRNE